MVAAGSWRRLQELALGLDGVLVCGVGREEYSR